MASLIRVLNTLIPFTDAATPLWRDILHTTLLCTFLYFAPIIQWHKIADGFWWIGSKPELEAPRRRPPDGEPIDGGGGLPPDLELEQREPPHNDDEHHADDTDEDEGLFIQQDENRDAAGADPPVDQNRPPVAEAGPANGHAQLPQAHQPQRRRDPNRPVGAKKQKSLARREQIRQYHEFQRQQSEMQRARDAEGTEEREAAQAAERERRRKVEEKIQAEKAKEREKRRLEEERTREKEMQDRRRAIHIVHKRLSGRSCLLDLQQVAKSVGRDIDWVEDLVRREGLLGTNHISGKRTLTITTKHGWLARVDADIMNKVYDTVAKWDERPENGRVSWADIGGILKDALRNK